MGQLDDVCRAGGGRNGGTKAQNEPSGDEMPNFHCGSLHRGADDDDEAPDEDAPAAADAVREQAAD